MKININLGGPAMVLFVVFLVLRLCGVIAWSWWWVTAPLWGGFLLTLVILAAILAFVAVRRIR